MNQSNTGNVLITGADGGLGLPVVRRLLSAGWNVFAFLYNDDKAGVLKEQLSTDEQARLTVITGDVTLAEDVEKIVDDIKDIDALVHLVGGFAGAASMAEHDVVVFDHMFDLNTRSTFLLLREIMPLMKKKHGGSIVTIGAKPALIPGSENAVYAASKAALINLTLTAAEEGRPYHVRANAIAPAVIRTAANMKWGAPEEEVRKWTAPEDIAEVVLWLISDAGQSVTGTVIPMYNQIKP